MHLGMLFAGGSAFGRGGSQSIKPPSQLGIPAAMHKRKHDHCGGLDRGAVFRIDSVAWLCSRLFGDRQYGAGSICRPPPFVTPRW